MLCCTVGVCGVGYVRVQLLCTDQLNIGYLPSLYFSSTIPPPNSFPFPLLSLSLSHSLTVDHERTNKNQGNRRHLYLENSPKPYFHPHVFLMNLVKYSDSDKEEWYDIDVKDVPGPNGSIVKEADVCYRLSGLAKFQQKMELKDFPMDVCTQSLVSRIFI